MKKINIQKIKQQLQKPLPGKQTQYLMAPKHRYALNTAAPPEDAKKSAVLLLIFPYKNESSIVFIKRNNDAKYHRGQIAFPGGTYEETDKTLINTVLREVNEEIGVEKNLITIIGKLTPLYIPVSNFFVQPFVGVLNTTPTFIPQESEVQKIIKVSIEELFKPENKATKILNKYNAQFEAPYYNANGEHIWGATAMILSEFEHLIKKLK